MSDFLANLLARATGAAESIRPRPISLFELTAPLPNLPPQETLPPEGEARESVSAPLAQKLEPPPSGVETAQTSPEPRRQPSSAPVRIVEPAISCSDRPAGDVGRFDKPPSREVVDVVLQKPVIPSRTYPEPQFSAKTRQIQPRQDETIPASPQTTPETRTILREVKQTEIKSEPAPPKPLHSHVAPLVSTGVAPAPTKPLREPALSEPPAPLPPMIARVPQGAMRQMTPAPTEPVIHVTIGRIEVRALHQEGSAKQRRASSTVMSLEEYLGSRKKAGAR